MAYDPNDPADKAILDKAVKDALEAQKLEHEEEIQGLRDKNQELLGKLRKARTEGGSENAGEIERLENDLHEAQAKLRKAEGDLRQVNRELATVTSERDTARGDLTAERDFSRNELVNNRLTAELVGVNVASQFLDDVTASLARQVTVKEVDGKREAFVGDKPLGEFVKEWAGTDKGKHYVTAPANGGGGTQNPGNPQGGPKKIAEMSLAERNAHFNAIGKEAFEQQVAAEKAAPKS